MVVDAIFRSDHATGYGNLPRMSLASLTGSSTAVGEIAWPAWSPVEFASITTLENSRFAVRLLLRWRLGQQPRPTCADAAAARRR